MVPSLYGRSAHTMSSCRRCHPNCRRYYLIVDENNRGDICWSISLPWSMSQSKAEAEGTD